jgi:hypothetical protein
MQLFSTCNIHCKQTNKQTNNEASKQANKGCVTLWPLPFTLKSILRQKKNYGNTNISPCKNIIFKKSSERNPKSFKL